MTGARARTDPALADLAAVAAEQTALRRIAELVARGASPAEVFPAVTTLASALLDDVAVTLISFAGEHELVVMATRDGPAAAAGARIAFDAGTLPDRVRRGGHVDRVEDSTRERDVWLAARTITAAVAAPIVLADTVWGMLAATSDAGPLPSGVEDRLRQFAELVGAALAGSRAREDLRALADEQTALRRIAELIAREAPAAEVLHAVAVQASALAGVEFGMVHRYESDGSTEIMAIDGAPPNFAVGMHAPETGDGSVHRVWRTGRAARVDDLSKMSGQWPRFAHEYGFTRSAGVPIYIQGRLWGTIIVVGRDALLPPAIEQQLNDFAEIVSTAIAASEARAELHVLAAKLTASRARVLATADETRRRVQRDLHDGAQQRLVHALIALKLAREAAAAGHPALDLIDDALANVERANNELRDLVRGILPASLTGGGLAAGLKSLVADVSLPVDLRVRAPRLAAPIETTAYFIVAEALTNVVKHARATRAVVDVTLEGNELSVLVRDDGTGGADAHGSGLTGLSDRVEAYDGTLTVTSPPGAGTEVQATLTLAAGVTA